ncbi:MAG: MerC domain-containing protein [Polyangiaceae bacterium]|nr:MerC domain-containing protein [Polyangiaceae bacterium]
MNDCANEECGDGCLPGDAQSTKPKLITVDRWGAITSATCAVHCLVFALLPGLISALGLGLFFTPALEWTLLVLALFMASLALFMGWRRHASVGVVVTFCLGGIALLLGRVFEEMGVEGYALPVGVLGAMLLISGHILNARRTRQARS